MKNHYLLGLTAISIMGCTELCDNQLAHAGNAGVEQKSWCALINGKSAEERWSTFGKTAPKLLGMTRADVEKALGKGTYSEKQQELTYQFTDMTTSKEHIFDNVSISFDKNGHVMHFVTISKLKD